MVMWSRIRRRVELPPRLLGQQGNLDLVEQWWQARTVVASRSAASTGMPSAITVPRVLS